MKSGYAQIEGIVYPFGARRNKPMWVDGTGEKRSPSDMGENHIFNCIALLEKRRGYLQAVATRHRSDVIQVKVDEIDDSIAVLVKELESRHGSG